MNGESAPRTHAPSSSSAMFLWQYEFEQSLMNQQLQYQQQAKAMEVSIKEAAQQAAAGAAEVGKLLRRENDASTVDIMKELTSSSRRDIEGVASQVPPLTPEFFRSKSIPNSPIRQEEKGNEKGSHQLRSRGTSEMRRSRSQERRRKQRSRSRSRERRRRHRSRSSSRERRRRHRSRSNSRERSQHSIRGRIREKRRRESRRRSRRSRSQSRTRKKFQESCRSSENKRRRESDICRSPPKGHNQDELSFPGSPDSRSPSSPNRSKQRRKSKQRNTKSLSPG